MSNIFDNAIDKGRISQKHLDWPHQLSNGETYAYIASNDIHNISKHIERLEGIIDELMLQIERERDRQ